MEVVAAEAVADIVVEAAAVVADIVVEVVAVAIKKIFIESGVTLDSIK